MAEKDETVNINVLIAERAYPVKVVRADEEKVKSAVSLIHQKMKDYQQQFEGKDKQDYLAMCLLNFAVEHVNLQSNTQQNDRLLDEKIKELEVVLSGVSK
ncbi:MAG TPA: cell division protein ZapA [Chitinophagales bacterium]|nr:cell division protein ZapA [Chitinophagales bacterium]